MLSLNNVKISTRFFVFFSLIVIVNVLGFIINASSINSIKKDTSTIYNYRFKGVDFLIEADRDAYQSSIAISMALNKNIYTNHDKLNNMGLSGLLGKKV